MSAINRVALWNHKIELVVDRVRPQSIRDEPLALALGHRLLQCHMADWVISNAIVAPHTNDKNEKRFIHSFGVLASLPI